MNLGELTYGELRHGDGRVYYTGGLLNGKPEGTGKLTYRNGETYEGEFKNGQRHGKGKLTSWLDGDVLEVNFKDNRKYGIGKITRANGEVQYYEYNSSFKPPSLFGDFFLRDPEERIEEHYGPQSWQNRLTSDEMKKLQEVARLGGSKRQRQQSKRRRQSKRRQSKRRQSKRH
jgi:hypothetical protein